mmetsp:Transcript_17501/g.37852  ORF Transcript_17501/g.37852 Transcript_17501/m.37852 type:complete len:207 (-) Transcript_17501:2085-2705(-)
MNSQSFHYRLMQLRHLHRLLLKQTCPHFHPSKRTICAISSSAERVGEMHQKDATRDACLVIIQNVLEMKSVLLKPTAKWELKCKRHQNLQRHLPQRLLMEHDRQQSVRYQPIIPQSRSQPCLLLFHQLYLQISLLQDLQQRPFRQIDQPLRRVMVNPAQIRNIAGQTKTSVVLENTIAMKNQFGRPPVVYLQIHPLHQHQQQFGLP